MLFLFNNLIFTFELILFVKEVIKAGKKLTNCYSSTRSSLVVCQAVYALGAELAVCLCVVVFLLPVVALHRWRVHKA